MPKKITLLLQKIFFITCLLQGLTIHAQTRYARPTNRIRERTRARGRIKVLRNDRRSNKKLESIQSISQDKKAFKWSGKIIAAIVAGSVVIVLPIIVIFSMKINSFIKKATIENMFHNFTFGDSSETEWQISTIKEFSKKEKAKLLQKGVFSKYESVISKYRVNPFLTETTIQAKKVDLSHFGKSISQDKSDQLANTLKEFIEDIKLGNLLDENYKEIIIKANVLSEEGKSWTPQQAVGELKKFGVTISNKLREESNGSAVRKINHIIKLTFDIKKKMEIIFDAMILLEAIQEELINMGQNKKRIKTIIEKINKELKDEETNADKVLRDYKDLMNIVKVYPTFTDFKGSDKYSSIKKKIIKKKMQLDGWIRCYSSLVRMISLVKQCFGTTEEFIALSYNSLKVALAKPITFTGFVYNIAQKLKEKILDITTLDLIVLKNIEETEDGKIKVKVNQNPPHCSEDTKATMCLKEALINEMISNGQIAKNDSDLEKDNALENLKDTKSGTYYILPKTWTKVVKTGLRTGLNTSLWGSHIKNGMKKSLAGDSIGFEGANTITDSPRHGLMRIKGGKPFWFTFFSPKWLKIEFMELFFKRYTAKALIEEVKQRLQTSSKARELYHRFFRDKQVNIPKDPHQSSLFQIKNLPGANNYAFEPSKGPLFMTLVLIQAITYIDSE